MPSFHAFIIVMSLVVVSANSPKGGSLTMLSPITYIYMYLQECKMKLGLGLLLGHNIDVCVCV